MPGLTAEHTEVVLEAMTALFISELSVLAELRGQVGRRGSLLLELTRTFGRLPGGIQMGGRVGGRRRRRRLGALIGGTRGLIGCGGGGRNGFRMTGLFGLALPIARVRSEEHTSELQSPC